MEKLSVFIPTLNEEKNILRCINSVKPVADEIIVVDSFSTDSTKSICLNAGVKFVENTFKGYIEQKLFALSLTSNNLVLLIDADEELSEELQRSVLKIKSGRKADAYSMNRLTNYCGKWIYHCGWYPDKKIRVFDKTKATIGGTNPHDKVMVNNEKAISHLEGDLLHYSYNSLDDHVHQLNRFSTIGARELYGQGKKYSLWQIIIKPPVKFIRDYIFNRGFLDGWEGFIICRNSAFATFQKYSKLRMLWKNNDNK